MTPEQINYRRQLLLDKCKGEDALTLKAMEALPADKFGWKPDHEKCWPAGELAMHSVGAANFFLALAKGETPPSEAPPGPSDKAGMLAAAGAIQAQYRSEIAEMSTEQLGTELDFMGQTFSALDVLEWHPWHMVHHRGQFLMYLRLMGAKVPSTYGPSGDEDYTGEA